MPRIFKTGLLLFALSFACLANAQQLVYNQSFYGIKKIDTLIYQWAACCHSTTDSTYNLVNINSHTRLFYYGIPSYDIPSNFYTNFGIYLASVNYNFGLNWSIYNSLAGLPKFVRLICRPSGYVPYGGIPVKYRNYFVGGVSLQLKSNLKQGNLYFTKIHTNNNWNGFPTTLKLTNVVVGVSNSDSLFGTKVNTISPPYLQCASFSTKHTRFPFTFISPDTSNYLTIMPEFDTTVYSQFLIGDFSLYPARSLGTRNVLVCKDDSVKISASVAGNSYDWSSGDTTQSIYAKDSGWYVSYIYITDSVLVDSVHLMYKGVNTYQKTDTTICKGTSTVLYSTKIATGNNYLWNTTDTTSTIAVNDSGKYIVRTYILNACSNTDTFNVHTNQHKFNYPPQYFDTTICKGQSLVFGNLPEANTSYFWNTNDTTPQLIIKDSGTYTRLRKYVTCQTTLTDTFVLHTQQPLPLLLPKYDTLCFGQSIVLNAHNNLYNKYSWNTTDTNAIIKVTTAGKYFVTASNNICSIKDSSVISILPLVDSLLNLPTSRDTVLCANNLLTLSCSKSQAQSNYLWNTGEVTPNIIATTSGWYRVKVNIYKCSRTDSIQITYKAVPPLKLITDTNLCEGNKIKLDVFDTTYKTYLWNTGTATSSITITQPGKYKVTASNGLCSTNDSVNVTLQSLPTINLPKDTIVCFDELNSILLSAPVGYASYRWYPTNENTASIFAKEARLYAVEVTDKNGCLNRDTTLIDEECKLRVFIPNAFTPNNDGVNDVFRISALHASEATMQIYNRWGEQVFYTGKALQEGWDGSRAFDGEYFYIVHCSSKDQTQTQDLKGMFRLLR